MPHNCIQIILNIHIFLYLQKWAPKKIILHFVYGRKKVLYRYLHTISKHLTKLNMWDWDAKIVGELFVCVNGTIEYYLSAINVYSLCHQNHFWSVQFKY